MRRLLLSLAMTWVMVEGAAMAQEPGATITVGTAVARRGETAYGELRVGAGSDAALTMSLAVVHGARPGPVVAFVAGSHGTRTRRSSR